MAPGSQYFGTCSMDNEGKKDAPPIEPLAECDNRLVAEDGDSDDCVSDESDLDDVSEKPWLLDSDPPLKDSQFGLRALFALTTACGLYFFLERVFQGQFAFHALAALALALGVAAPIAWLLMGFLRLAMSVREPFGTLLLMSGICGLVLWGLTAMFGF